MRIHTDEASANFCTGHYGELYFKMLLCDDYLV